MSFSATPLPVAFLSFGVATALLLAVGWRFTRAADVLADRTGMGEALGGVLLGALTSLPGLITSGVAAWEGRPNFAVSNAVGGIAAQTAFIVVADLFHRRDNLEHAAASLPNLLQCTVLIALLALVLMGTVLPGWTLGTVHPTTFVLLVVYGFGLNLTREGRRAPMWLPRTTPGTRLDEPDAEAMQRSLAGVWLRFLGAGLVVAASGWMIAWTGLAIADRTNLSDSFVGGVMTSVASSMPELVTAVLAVRAGALTLAVANIVGGNTFDVLIVGVADALEPGSIYRNVDAETVFVTAETILLTAVLAAGLLRRERKGIGFEGLGIVLIYGLGVFVLARGL